MKQRGKTIWHKVKPNPYDPDAPGIAKERAFVPNQDGTVRGGESWMRGTRTVAEWRRYTLKPEYQTVAALEGYLRANGFSRGSAPKHTLPPSLDTLHRWDWDRGGCEAVCGCFVEPDGECGQHRDAEGKPAPSWMRAYGLI